MYEYVFINVKSFEKKRKEDIENRGQGKKSNDLEMSFIFPVDWLC
jgi:hypothetical protein